MESVARIAAAVLELSDFGRLTEETHEALADIVTNETFVSAPPKSAAKKGTTS